MEAMLPCHGCSCSSEVAINTSTQQDRHTSSKTAHLSCYGCVTSLASCSTRHHQPSAPPVTASTTQHSIPRPRVTHTRPPAVAPQQTQTHIRGVMMDPIRFTCAD